METQQQSSNERWLIDAHMHLGFSNDPKALADRYHASHIGGLVATVTPHEYRRLQHIIGKDHHLAIGLGAHPWWIHEGKISDEHLNEMLLEIPHVRCVAEIGLDFSRKFTEPEGQDRQIKWFKSICQTTSQCIADSDTPYVLSIHAVKASTEVLDILEHYNLPSRATCIFHWFSGTHAELIRAVNMGCYFSVNEMMLQSKRAKSYIQTMPSDHILLETDMPDEDGNWTVKDERQRLINTCNILHEIQGESNSTLSPESQAKIFGIEL